MSEARENPAARPVRSYVIRSGRLTSGQRRALAAYSTDYLIDYEPGPLPVGQLFAREQPLTVEIGFGSGDSLLRMARERPRQNFLGIDVYQPGAGRVLQGVVEHGLENIRLICHDAVEVFRDNLPEESLDRVLILFPDPWPRKRHHKRRLVQTGFMQVVLSRLKPGGEAHLATDWPPYLEQMMEVMEGIAGFRNRCGDGCCWDNPARPSTRFELRGRRLGHEVRDLLYYKVESGKTRPADADEF